MNKRRVSLKWSVRDGYVEETGQTIEEHPPEPAVARKTTPTKQTNKNVQAKATNKNIKRLKAMNKKIKPLKAMKKKVKKV